MAPGGKKNVTVAITDPSERLLQGSTNTIQTLKLYHVESTRIVIHRFISAMEKNGFKQKIQGGGAGEGLPLPIQVTDESDEKKKERMDRIVEHAKGSTDVGDMFNHCDNNDSQIWMQSLKLHFNSTLTICNTGNIESEIGASSPAEEIEKEVADQLSGPISSKRTIENVTCQPSKKAKETENRISIPILQVIPRVPKRAKEIVSLWFHGCDKRAFRPVRLFDTRPMRESIIPHYSDQKWTNSGQKRAYYRFKRIINAIGAHNGKIGDINCSDERKWDAAIRSFEAFWSVDGKMKPLSVIEKQL